MTGVVQLQSGSPFPVTQITNFNSFAGFGTQRPNRIGNPNLVLPMALGSMVGATAGGLLVDIAPVELLKVSLGALLVFSSLRVFHEPKVVSGANK